MSILNKSVSYFPSKSATTKGIEVNLLTLLQSDKHKERIINLRASTAEVQKQLKDKLPCFTVAGTFNPRSEEGLLQLSGLAAVDLDSAEDYDIQHLLKELKKIPSIAYAGLSCRGKRLYSIVPFLYPDKYQKHYERLIKSFADMGLPMGDECHKALSQPRFISWNEDNTQFFRHDAKPYHLLAPERTYHHIKRDHQSPLSIGEGQGGEVFAWCNEQINKSHQFTTDNRHSYIMALARYCNIKGLPEDNTLNGCLNYVQPDFPEREIKSIVKHIYTTQADSHNSIPFKQAKTKQEPIQPPLNAPPPLIEKHYIKDSFIGTDGKFYIPNPVQHERYAVYETPEAYNERKHIPQYIDKSEAMQFLKEIMPVDIETLKTVLL